MGKPDTPYIMNNPNTCFSKNHLLWLFVMVLPFAQCTKSGRAFVKVTHIFGKVVDIYDNTVVPGCNVRFYRLRDVKGSLDYTEVGSCMSGPDGSYSITFERTMGDYDFAYMIDSVPNGYAKDESLSAAVNEELFKGAGEVNTPVFVCPYGYMNLHIVGDGDSPRMDLTYSQKTFYHGCDTSWMFRWPMIYPYRLYTILYDANNPGVSFARYDTLLFEKHKLLEKTIHF